MFFLPNNNDGLEKPRQAYISKHNSEWISKFSPQDHWQRKMTLSCCEKPI